jgi:hypothetical protein
VCDLVGIELSGKRAALAQIADDASSELITPKMAGWFQFRRLCQNRRTVGFPRHFPPRDEKE